MKKYLRTAINWILIIMTALYFISGFALAHKYGCDLIMTREISKWIHKNLAIPYLAAIISHIFLYSKFKLNK